MDLYEKRQLTYKHMCYTAILICIAVVITACGTYIYCGGVSDDADFFTYLSKDVQDENSDARTTIKAIGESLKSFRSVIDMFYIGEIDEEKLLDGAIKGYVEGLGDQYSEYMTKEEWEEYQASALGNYVGIGIYMGTNKDGYTIVSSPIKDSPAEKVGLKTEDIIVEVDGEEVLDVDSSIIASKIKGKEGTKVHLKVARKSEYLEFDIERKEIKLYHVESEVLDNNIGYLSLLTFDEGCAEELEAKVKELEEKGIKKLILDLRYNGGGLVDEALDIADIFIEKDKDILITLSSDNDEEISKTKKNQVTDAELVVLVNEYSASASEILVGALKDNNRAKVVGTTTFGKGVIQNVFSLKDGSVLKLTVAEYFTPKRTKINKTGIKPDFEVELPEVEKEEDFVDTQLNKAKELLK